jgi:hypothetical protein
MSVLPESLKLYHVFLASPGDVNEERQLVRQFFDKYNRHTARLWSARFEVVDWENYSTIGVGRPQELITQQTLQQFRHSLALVIGVMAQRFGSPTGKAESGTEEEFAWAMQSNQASGFPEIKWFFRRVDKFVAPPDPAAIATALGQWNRVCAFRERLQAQNVFFAEYTDLDGFRDLFQNDLSLWLADHARPWVTAAPKQDEHRHTAALLPHAYFESIEREFHRLDIAGIDNDRAFEIPLSDIYVRLRVVFEEGMQAVPEQARDAGPIDIQTALLRYEKLVIVGDPGSGKSTFLKYVALMLARSIRENNPALAMSKLCLQEPLPIPIFVSCWDLSDYLKQRATIEISALLDFITERLASWGFSIKVPGLESLLGGNCCFLFDGLDEVPTETGRAAVSRLLEDCVKRFPKNRYIVTSRVRAYTGDTILKGEFTRCDVQPFDANDRAEFLKNWIGLLFKVSPGQVPIGETDAAREFKNLCRAIETSDRIAQLAVNPLLLTVVAIVHWNRKRLPEQRVDLYNECVDVLLGQRKEAEHIQLTRKTGALDQEYEQQQREERAWVRKRFAEIALAILVQEDTRDETTKLEILKLLAPRFVDKGARTMEEAETRAGLFLERQELRSGLLVSRREQSYRFVHLTFQEYLSAWHLSNQEFHEVVIVLEPRLRRQRWFETLQLLAGQWAKQSDEKLDRYLSWILGHQGETIAERAPVVALCANIVKDTSGTAELKPETRRAFQTAVEGTLDAFRPASGIPALTQLEILEALGELGAAVKSHLLTAAKSGLYQVRRRAVEMLLPHLTDDELFGMDHLLQDRSKEPIKTFLLYLLTRNPQRTATWLQNQKGLSAKATEGFSEITDEFQKRLSDCEFQAVLEAFFRRGKSFYDWWSGGDEFVFLPGRARLVSYVSNDKLLRNSIINDSESAVRALAMAAMVRRSPEDPALWSLICERARTDDQLIVRVWALSLLIQAIDRDARTRALVVRRLFQPWGLGPDPARRVENSFVQERAAKLSLTVAECQRLYEELSYKLQQRFRFSLGLAWRPDG